MIQRLYTQLATPLNSSGVVKKKDDEVASTYVRLSLIGTFDASETIILSNYTQTNANSIVYEVELVSTEYGEFKGYVSGSSLNLGGGFDGTIKVKAWAADDETAVNEKVISVECTEIAETQYSVNNVVVNGGNNISTDATSAIVTFNGYSTPIYTSGRTGSTTEQKVTQSVTFNKNTTDYDTTRGGVIMWNGVEVNWNATQVAHKYIRLTLDNSYEDSAEIMQFANTNVSDIVYTIDVVSTDYGEFQGYVDDDKIVCAGHFDGVIKITASSEDGSVTASKQVTIYCNDYTTEYSVDNIVANAGENVAADATTIDVAFTGKSTIVYESGRIGETTSTQETQSVSVEPNESPEAYAISGNFDWNGITVEWNATQEGAVAAISQETLDLIEYYGVERTDAQKQALDTFLTELKAHAAYSHITDVILPILAPKSDKTEIEGYIASNTEKDTSNYPEIQKAFHNIISNTEYTRNIRSWFIGKNGVRTYKTNTGRKYILYPSNIIFDTALISGGVCSNIPMQSKLCDLTLKGSSIAVRINNSSWATRENFVFADTTEPKMYANSIDGKAVKAALNGVSSSAIADVGYSDGVDTTLSTNRLFRIDSTTTDNGLSTSFDDPNGVVVSALFLCKDYAMSQEELNSITTIFRNLVSAFWED